jgi:hypothetical protein
VEVARASESTPQGDPALVPKSEEEVAGRGGKEFFAFAQERLDLTPGI